MANRIFHFLTALQVKQLYNAHILHAAPTQSTLLESAVNSPMNIKYYEKQEDIFQLAANLSEKIAKNHAFQDSNKRAAFVAADTFLKINRWRLQAQILGDESCNFGLGKAVEKVTTGHITVEQLGEHYKSVATQIPPGDVTEKVQQYRSDAITY